MISHVRTFAALVLAASLLACGGAVVDGDAPEDAAPSADARPQTDAARRDGGPADAQVPPGDGAPDAASDDDASAIATDGGDGDASAAFDASQRDAGDASSSDAPEDAPADDGAPDAADASDAPVLSSTQSTLTASPSVLPADGVSAATLTAIARDDAGNPLPDVLVEFTVTEGNDTVTPSSGRTDGSGTVRTSVTSKWVQNVQVSARFDGQFTQAAVVSFTAGPPVASTSTLAVTPSSVPADGVSTARVTLTALDVGGRPVRGDVEASVSGSQNILTIGTRTTDPQQGTWTATLASYTAEAKTVTVTVTSPAGSLTLAAPVTFTPPNPAWKQANVGLYGGAVTALAFDPSTPGTAYAGTVDGVFRSTDSGQSWTSLSPTRGAAITYVGVKPDDPQTIFAAGPTIPGVPYDGMLVSRDGGSSWSAIGGLRGFGDSIADIAFSAQHPDTMLAVSTEDYVSRSIDAGRHWVTTVPDLTGLGAYRVAFAPSDDRIAYVTTALGVSRSVDGGVSFTACPGLSSSFEVAIDPRSADHLFVTNGTDVFASSDGCQTWSKLSPAGVTGGLCRIALAAPSVIEVGACTDGTVYRSSDAGATWSTADEGRAPVSAIVIDPVQPGHVLVGLGNAPHEMPYRVPYHSLLASSDGGATFAPSDSGITTAWVTSLAFDAAGAVYAAAGGVYTSRGPNGAWQLMSPAGLPKNVGAKEVAVDVDGSLYVTTFDGAWKHPGASGGTWSPIAPGPASDEYSGLAVDPVTPGIVYVAHGAGMFRSADGGSSWTQLAFVHSPLGFAHRQQPNIVYADYDGIWRSTDGGQTFALAGNNRADAYALAVDPTNPDVILERASSWTAAYSLDGGATWTNASLPIDVASQVMAVAIDPFQPNVFYAAMESSGVWRSDDRGTTWTAAGSGLERAQPVCIAASPVTPGLLYVGTSNGGVYETTTGGR